MSEKLKEKSKRVRRLHIEEDGALFIDEKHKRPGFVRRIVKDTPGRIKKFEKYGYTIVKDETKIGDGKAGDKSQLGSAVTVELGRRSQMTGVLMEIPQEIYDEIQDEKQEYNDQQIQSLYDEEIPKENIYGELVTGRKLYKHIKSEK